MAHVFESNPQPVKTGTWFNGYNPLEPKLSKEAGYPTTVGAAIYGVALVRAEGGGKFNVGVGGDHRLAVILGIDVFSTSRQKKKRPFCE